MPDELTVALILFPIGLVAGTINAIAAGGSMLTLPILIFLGLPPTVANATNRVALVVQNVGAFWSFRSKGIVNPGWLRLAVPPSLAGVVIGALMAVFVEDDLFQVVLAIVLVVAAAWTVWNPLKPPVHGAVPPPEGRARVAYAVGFFVVGVFGGFIQAGVGFIVLALTSAAGLDLVRGNALKVPLVLTFTILALGIFAYNGLVEWMPGLALGAGNVLGALFGIRLQIAKGHAWVRNVLTVTVVLFAARLLWSV